MKSTQLEIEEILKRFGEFEILRWNKKLGASLLSIKSLSTDVKYTHYVGVSTKREVLAEINNWMQRMVKIREQIHESKKSLERQREKVK